MISCKINGVEVLGHLFTFPLHKSGNCSSIRNAEKRAMWWSTKQAKYLPVKVNRVQARLQGAVAGEVWSGLLHEETDAFIFEPVSLVSL